MHVRTLIVGGGAAGLAPLVAASRDGRLEALLHDGLAIVERGPTIGAGRLGRYAITSDSTAETFLAAVAGHVDPRLGQLQNDPISEDFARLGRAPVPLREAGRLLDKVGSVLAEAVDTGRGAVLTGHEAEAAQRQGDGTWRLDLRRTQDGTVRHVTTENLVLATGGVQDLAALSRNDVAGRPLLPACAGRLMLSDELLRPESLPHLRARLASVPSPRVAIVGGSTSALATAGLLLRDCGDLLAAPGSISILHRRPLRVFYPSVAAAEIDGYRDFGPDDICPLSGFVYRLAGFRLDSRELVMRLLGIGGRPPEPRIVLRSITSASTPDVQRCLDGADLVVAATGYTPRALPVRGKSGRDIRLRGHSGSGPLVDRNCRICDTLGRPIPNLFGIGLAAGFVPSGKLGGEPSFRGQANGLWLWQTAVGAMIVDQLLAEARPASAGILHGMAAEPAVAAPAWPAMPVLNPG